MNFKIYRIQKSIMFRIISIFSVKHFPAQEKHVFLTFDDGPEPGITEFVLEELKKYNAKATFFCTGRNYSNYPELIQRIKQEGHSLANHTHTHMNGLNVKSNVYMEDVNQAKELIKSDLFRPPWAALSLAQLFKVKKENRIILWSLSSNDSNPHTNWKSHALKMTRSSRNGEIVLLHFCIRHEPNTREILPLYMKLMSENGFGFYSITNSILYI